MYADEVGCNISQLVLFGNPCKIYSIRFNKADKNSQSLTNRHQFVLILVMSTFELKNSS